MRMRMTMTDNKKYKKIQNDMERQRAIRTHLLRNGWITVLCAGCLLAGGCSADGEAGPGREEPGSTSALSISSLNVSQARTRAASAGYTEITDPGAQMGLFRKKAGTWYTVTVENLPYEYHIVDGTPRWEAPAGATAAGTLWLDHHQAQISACYPYNSALAVANPGTGDGIVKLTAAERDTASPQDLWYGHDTADNRNPRIAYMQLRQAYCRMQVTVVYDKNFSYTAGETYLYELTISGGRAADDTQNTGIYSTGTLDTFADGTDGYLYTAKDYKAIAKANSGEAYKLGETAADTGAKFDLMMLPNTLTGAVNFSVVLGGTTKGTDTREMNVDIPAADFGSKLEPGKIYSVKLTIKGMDITKVMTATTDWNPTVTSGTGTTADGQKHFDMSVE